MSYSVFDIKSTGSNLEQTMFLGESVAIARYDRVKYPQFEKLTRKQLGYFWMPDVSADLSRDGNDFKSLTDEEEHIFTSNVKRQIVLDSTQARALSAAFGPIVSLPELENWFKTQEFFEGIHNRTYTHILRKVYPDGGAKVFDEMMDIVEIVDCAKQVTLEYDRLIDLCVERHALGWATEWDPPSSYWSNGFDHLQLKRQIWRTVHAVNALEGIRFYVSFICSWAFAEQNKMEGNAKLIKMIARDENLHLAAFQQIIKLLPKDDPDFVTIALEERNYIYELFLAVVEQEKTWAKYLFKDGSMLGLNEEILCQYVDHIAAKRAQAVGIQGFKSVPNPLPWASKWIAGGEIQEAPQQTTKTSYIIGGIENDAASDSFKGFKL
jgi:ribonucleoside-diphosphate reductase beta chain